MEQANEILKELNDAESLSDSELTASDVLPKVPEKKEIRQVKLVTGEELIAEIDTELTELNLYTTLFVYGRREGFPASRLVIGRIMLFGQDVCNNSAIYQKVDEYVKEYCE